MRLTDSSPAALRRSIHGQVHEDPYHWLSGDEDAEIVALLDDEHARLRDSTEHLAPLQRIIEEEFRDSTPAQEADLPMRCGSWWYFGYITAGQQHPSIRRIAAGAADELPPDPTRLPDDVQESVIALDEIVPQGGYVGMGGFDFSDAGDRAICALDLVGNESYALHVRELPSGKTKADELVGIGPGALLSRDGTRIFYSTRDERWRCNSIWEHRIGEPQSGDRLLYREHDERFHLTFRMSRSGRYLVLHAESRTTTEELLLDLRASDAVPRPVWPRQDGIAYTVEHVMVAGEDRLVVLHNTPRSPQEFVVTDVDIREPSDPAFWHAIVDVPTGAQLLGVEGFAAMLLISFTSGMRDCVAVITFGAAPAAAEGSGRGIALTEWATASGYAHIQEVDPGDPLVELRSVSKQSWDQRSIRLQTRSFARPPEFVEYDPASRRFTTLRSQRVPSHLSMDAYAQDRIWATAEDGTQVPISLVWNREAVREGPAPMVLYAYGAYGVSIRAGFEATRLSLLDRGVICAIAHVRGGGELGPAWHAAGKLLSKRNTFTDLIACARELIDRGVTAPKQIVIEGGSAGGLTVGAAANMAPELFAGVVAEVPFVDPLNTLLDASSPLTVTEWEEWGNPVESAEAFEYIRSYSPYENIPTSGGFPKVLALTSLFDARVAYSEAAKWVARLRDNGVVAHLAVERTGGHTRVSGRQAAHASGAFVYAWILDTLDAERTPSPAKPGEEGQHG